MTVSEKSQYADFLLLIYMKTPHFRRCFTENPTPLDWFKNLFFSNMRIPFEALGYDVGTEIDELIRQNIIWLEKNKVIRSSNDDNSAVCWVIDEESALNLVELRLKNWIFSNKIRASNIGQFYFEFGNIASQSNWKRFDSATGMISKNWVYRTEGHAQVIETLKKYFGVGLVEKYGAQLKNAPAPDWQKWGTILTGLGILITVIVAANSS